MVPRGFSHLSGDLIVFLKVFEKECVSTNSVDVGMEASQMSCRSKWVRGSPKSLEESNYIMTINQSLLLPRIQFIIV